MVMRRAYGDEGAECKGVVGSGAAIFAKFAD
jgi:hypothetical protein